MPLISIFYTSAFMLKHLYYILKMLICKHTQCIQACIGMCMYKYHHPSHWPHHMIHACSLKI